MGPMNTHQTVLTRVSLMSIWYMRATDVHDFDPRIYMMSLYDIPYLPILAHVK